METWVDNGPSDFQETPSMQSRLSDLKAAFREDSDPASNPKRDTEAC
jgi:hypothetical protein